jgi:hypothetical protein
MEDPATSRQLVTSELFITEVSPSQKLIVIQPVKNFLVFHGTRRVHYYTHRSLRLIPTLRQMNPVHKPTSYISLHNKTVMMLHEMVTHCIGRALRELVAGKSNSKVKLPVTISVFMSSGAII